MRDSEFTKPYVTCHGDCVAYAIERGFGWALELHLARYGSHQVLLTPEGMDGFEHGDATIWRFEAHTHAQDFYAACLALAPSAIREKPGATPTRLHRLGGLDRVG